MKKLFILLVFFTVYGVCQAQTLRYIIFSGGTSLSSISFITNQKIIIQISADGNLLEWGMEQERGRYYSQPGKLEPYLGRVEYYANQFDSTLNGKVKNIGVTSITYYGSQDNLALAGKVKSIGSIYMDYFAEYEDKALMGKLKKAGQKFFSYYSSFDNDAYKGKLKSVGSNQITYYSTFDDKSISGKMKSIGPFRYTWYTSFESSRYHGGLKSGSQVQILDGVTYILW